MILIFPTVFALLKLIGINLLFISIYQYDMLYCGDFYVEFNQIISKRKKVNPKTISNKVRRKTKLHFTVRA